MKALAEILAEDSVDGLTWSLSIVPRPNAAPLVRRTLRARGVDRSSEVGPQELEPEITSLCRALGVRQKTREVVKMKELDLAEISLGDIAAAKRIQLVEIEAQLEEITGQRDELARQIETLEAADLVPVGETERREPTKTPEAGDEPSVTNLNVLHAMRSDPSKQWVARYVAKELGIESVDGVHAVKQCLDDLANTDRVIRGERGRFSLPQ